MQKRTDFYIKIILGIILLFLIIGWACTMGTANLSVISSIKILMSKIPFLGEHIDLTMIGEQYFKIIWNIRLPRILTALFAGMGLSVAGVVFQGIFRNPMADPYVLGISSGATFGVALSFVLPTGGLIFGLASNMIFAFSFALITILFVYKISTIGNKAHVQTMLLTGIAMNYLFSSFTTILLVYNRHSIEKVYSWTLGSLNASSKNDLKIVIPVVLISIGILYTKSKDLNLLLLGEKDAKSLGVDINRLKKVTILISSFMLCVIISLSGSIGFVGLIIPHIARFIVGPNHKRLIPMSALIGGVFLILCDTIARSLFAPKELSVGIITSMVGVPFFLYLLYQGKRRNLNG